MKLHFSFREKVFLWALILLFGASSMGVGYSFYTEKSTLTPVSGGKLIEGVVGDRYSNHMFHPLFSEGGYEDDIAHILFPGLMRYDPASGAIVDYLATHEVSEDGKTYTFTLKDGITWQDGQDVTVNDILYTYRDVIQHEDFSHRLLREAFENVSIRRVNEKTVSFTIEEGEPRRSFYTNFTIGLLPRHILVSVPVAELERDPFFDSYRAAYGPYQIKETGPAEKNYTDIKLIAYEDFFLGEPKVSNLTFRIFDSRETLLENIDTLDAIYPEQNYDLKNLPDHSKFAEYEAISPQYVALFFNFKDNTLIDKKIRQSMRASVDTNYLAQKYEGIRVDSPLVELWPKNEAGEIIDDTIINISQVRAGELLNEAGYYFSSERPAPEEEDTNTETGEDSSEETTETVVEEGGEDLTGEATYVYEPMTSKRHATDIAETYLVGSFPAGTTRVTVNGYNLRLFDPANERFSYLLKFGGGISTMVLGENTYTIRFYDREGNEIDEETVLLVYEPDDEKRAALLKNWEEESLPEEEEEANEVEVGETEEIVPEEANESYRTNADGEHVTLTLIYLYSVPHGAYLRDLAEDLRTMWGEIGIEIEPKELSAEEFREALEKREYELLLLPEHLGYNLDPYSYFHLSEAREGGFNFANWKDLQASTILEDIRTIDDHEEYKNKLVELRNIMIDEVPAIFLYTPKQTWLLDKKVKNVTIEHMATKKDRYGNISDFYIRQGRTLNDVSTTDFFAWFTQQTKDTFSFSFLPWK